MNNLLFVYGTLLDNDNEFAVYLRDNGKLYAEGRIRGKLYDIGEYPGAVLSDEDNSYVYGVILKLDNATEVLHVVDEYEGFGAGQTWPNEFVRVLTIAETEKGAAQCWIYLYNFSTTNLPQITSGKYQR